MALDAATLQRLATMNQADATALLSGMADLQSIAINATPDGEGGTSYGDLRPIYTNGGEGTETNGPTGFQKILTPDLEGAADIKGRARFVGNYDTAGKLTGVERQDMGLSGGFLSENLETIGPLAVALAAGAGALASGGTGSTATAATAATVDPTAAAYAGEAAGTSATAAGGGAAAAPTMLDRILANPLAQQAAGMLLASSAMSQAVKPAQSIDPTPAPAAPTASPAATQPELAPIYASLSGTTDTPASTFLTGPGGIDPTKLRLGRNVLLGA